MNFSLVNKLTKKWSNPNSLPAKGYELVRGEQGPSPCAQSEAIMLSKGMGVMDFEAFLKGSMARMNRGLGISLDRITAKTLRISIIHSILLRRFNDLSSQSPAIVLNEPERVLGKNWARVLEFWHFIDSISKERWRELLENLPEKTRSDEYVAQKVALKSLTESLDVIIPDLYYLPGVTAKPLDSFSVRKISEEELAQKRPDFKIHHSSNQQKPVLILDPDSEQAKKYPNDTPHFDEKIAVVGDYSRAYFGWIAPYDYFQSNSPFPPLTAPDLISKFQVLFACATNEIQTLQENQKFEELYFCKLIGYDPTKNYTLKRLTRKFEEYKNSLADKVERFYLITNNYLFSRFSKDPEVKKEATKEMVKGLLELTESDIIDGLAYGKIQETFEVGKGRFFGSLRFRVPKLGPNTETNSSFYQLIQKLKEDYEVNPQSFCDVDGSSSEAGSEWAISSKTERIRSRFNAPQSPLRRKVDSMTKDVLP